jgi:hypothetical protein
MGGAPPSHQGRAVSPRWGGRFMGGAPSPPVRGRKADGRSVFHGGSSSRPAGPEPEGRRTGRFSWGELPRTRVVAGGSREHPPRGGVRPRRLTTLTRSLCGSRFASSTQAAQSRFMGGPPAGGAAQMRATTGPAAVHGGSYLGDGRRSRGELRCYGRGPQRPSQGEAATPGWRATTRNAGRNAHHLRNPAACGRPQPPRRTAPPVIQGRSPHDPGSFPP